jgi:tRNA threonylcarbamoyladenosine biosynthesis protein TsaB
VQLLLDSSGSQLVCALADNDGIIVSEQVATGTPESRDIGAVAGRVLGSLEPRGLDSVVVGLGPGSFIGTRVAVSYANGLAAARHHQLKGVNSLAAIHAFYATGHSAVVRDARRGDVYLYCPGVEPDTRIVPIHLLKNELRLLEVDELVIEEISVAYATRRDVVGEVQGEAADAGVRALMCDGVPVEGLRGQAASTGAVDYVEPVYLRGFL